MRRIAPDKWKHFFAGIVMGILLQAAALFALPQQQMLGYVIVVVVIVVVSYGFELFSKVTGKGHHDVIDAIASIIGGIVGMLMMIALAALT